MPDVVIIGAGPAGLATAHRLRDEGLDVVVLEAEGRVGGRTLTVPVGGLAANTGALFVYRGTPAEEFAERFGVATAPFLPDTWGVHAGGATVVGTDNDRVVDALPVPDEAKRDLREFIRVALDEYAQQGRPEDATELGTQRMGERLAPLHPVAREILTRAIQGGSVADPSVLSAQYALRYFASYLAHEKENRLFPLDGMLAIPEALAAELQPGTVRLGARVGSIAEAHDGYEVVLEDGERIAAREVVFAVPSPVTAELAGPLLPAAKLDALAAVRMPGSTTLSVTADVSDAPDIARWAFVATCDVAFDAIINPLPTGEGETPTTARFVCYGNSAGWIPGAERDDATRERWIEDFLTVAPALRGRILGAHLQSWEHCFALLTPERAHALDALREPVAGLHFPGDWTSPTAGTHGAYEEGGRAAEEVLARLR